MWGGLVVLNETPSLNKGWNPLDNWQPLAFKWFYGRVAPRMYRPGPVHGFAATGPKRSEMSRSPPRVFLGGNLRASEVAATIRGSDQSLRGNFRDSLGSNNILVGEPSPTKG